MKIKELRAMPNEELKVKMAELERELVKDRAQVATGTAPKNPSKIRITKRTIAKIKTILADKEVPKKA